MQVEIISPRVTDHRIFQTGEVIEVPDAEGKRMIDRGHAKAPKVEKRQGETGKKE